MSRYEAVLFDWVGTLVHYQRGRWRLRRAHELVGWPIDEAGFETEVASLAAAHAEPDVQVAMLTEDCSVDAHRRANMLWFERAGLRPDLAEAVYALDSDPATHPPYPDAEEVLAELHSRGVKVAVVSDFHLDLRPPIARHGFADYIDALVVSSEHGFQKPDERMFTTALDLLGVKAGHALMVGDRPTRDGAAASIGIDTLILPVPDELSHRGLDVVLRLAD